MQRSLPLVDEITDPATRACASCHGSCCTEHVVTATGHDVWRLARGLAVPWHALVRVEQHPLPLYQGFRLDGSGTHNVLTLRRRGDGACRLLIELDGDEGRRIRRCGVHALRPRACRMYPLVPTDEAGGVDLGPHVICPDAQAAMYKSAFAQLSPIVDFALADFALYARVLRRWDLGLARFIPRGQPLPVDDFVAWVFAAYDAIAPLRVGPAEDWMLRAYERVDDLALPRPPV